MRHLILPAAFLLAAACGSAATTTPPPPPPATQVATVAVTPATASLAAGQTVQLVATPNDSAGTALSGHAVAWTSSLTSVATVSTSGLVTAVAVGAATISATSEGKSGTATISVGEVNTVSAAGGTVTAAGGNVVLNFAAGALSANTAVTIGPSILPAGMTGAIAGTAFEFGPSGTQFTNPVIATIKYQPSALPAGFDPVNLRLYTFGGGTSWTRMSSTYVDTANHTVTARLPHFSIFSLCGLFCSPVEPPAAPGLNFSGQEGGFPSALPGDSTPTFLDALMTHDAYADNPIFSLREYCPTSCRLSPGQITASFTFLGHPGETTYPNYHCGPSIPDCLVFFLWGLKVAPTTPPGVYIMGIVAQATVGSLVLQGESWGITVTVLAQGYTASLSPLGLVAAQGGFGNSTVTIARRNGFAGTVGLSVQGLPTGATASFGPASVTGTTSTLTLNVGTAVPARDYSLTLRATTPGSPDQTIPFGLTVTLSGFTVAGTPAFINTTAGSTAKTGIKATRAGGFGAAISYAVTGLPAGLTASVTTTTVADSVVLSVTAAGGMAAGNYPITVTATAPGALQQQLTITVTVAPAGVVAIHMDFSACSANAPVWVGYQDGAAPFVRATITGNTVDFNLSSAKVAVALVIPSGAGYSTSITYLTQTEMQSFNTNGGFAGSCGFAAGKTVTATVAGALDVFTAMGGASGSPQNAAPGFPAQLTGVASGSQDALAITFSSTPKAIIRRDQNIPNGGTIAFDFGGSDVFTPASALFSSGTAVNATMAYISVNGGVCVTNRWYTMLNQSGTFAIYGVPSAQQRPGDLHQFGVADATGQGASQQFHTFASPSLTFGGAIAPSVSATAGTYRLLTATVTLPTPYQTAVLNYRDTGGTGNVVTLQGTVGYFGSSATLAAPDLGSIGYLASWGPTATGTANWAMLATTSNNYTSTPAAMCADGLVTRTAQARGVK